MPRAHSSIFPFRLHLKYSFDKIEDKILCVFFSVDVMTVVLSQSCSVERSQEIFIHFCGFFSFSFSRVFVYIDYLSVYFN